MINHEKANAMLFPVGCDDFKILIDTKLYFVDKTLFIKEVLDDRGIYVAVITRPRRFGKTLNLSMLHHYLAAKVGQNSTEGLFDNLKITQCGPEYTQHKGKYPVVFLTFKEIADTSYELAEKDIAKVISDLYLQHDYLLASDQLKEQHKINFKAIVDRTADKALLKTSLKDLTEYLYLHTNTKPWILIDEYDAPIQAAYANGYYDEMTLLIRGMLGAALKTNPYLHRAVITGIFRIAKESLFSGLNNLKVYSILSTRYSEHFGFTESEVEAILKQANLTDKAEEIKRWYNGYLIGQTVVYNPWSIANCVQDGGLLQPYWVNAGENQLIKKLLKNSSINFKEQFELLMQGEKIRCLINENMVFHYLDDKPTAVWSLLLMSGYLKPVTPTIVGRRVLCEASIPNNEVRELYCEIIEQWLSHGLDELWLYEFIEALITGDIDTFKKGLNQIILQITSYHDFTHEPEAFFHGLMLGFLVYLHNNGYEVKSNHESGWGRYDIMLIPDDKTKLGIIIELKNCKSKSEKPNNNQNLIKLAEEGLKQIDELKYPEALKQRGITNILKIGIGFCAKRFELVSALES